MVLLSLCEASNKWLRLLRAAGMDGAQHPAGTASRHHIGRDVPADHAPRADDRAGANGDPTSLDLFHLPKMHAFNGMLTAIVQTNETAGEIILTAKAGGVKAGSIRLLTK